MDSVTTTACPGCGLVLPKRDLSESERFNASGECLDTFYELTYWTLERRDVRFIHQHAVDAYEAQHAGGKTKPMTVAFGLIGLFLALEKGYTGRQVQRAHMVIARRQRDWPNLEPPSLRAVMTVHNVVEGATDAEREELLMQWAASVWGIWEERHPWVREITEKTLFSN